jgi:hypothetical protein
VLFGQGAGAKAALLSGAARPAGIAAVIARGVLPDAVRLSLESVRVPALLLMETAQDRLAANLRMHARVSCWKAIAILPGRAAPEVCARAAAVWLRRELLPLCGTRSLLLNAARFAEPVG